MVNVGCHPRLTVCDSTANNGGDAARDRDAARPLGAVSPSLRQCSLPAGSPGNARSPASIATSSQFSIGMSGHS